MNGSRVNPNVMQDDFQDYDVVFVVTETSSFINDKKWINNFGNPFYFQLPDENPNFPNDKENFYGYLVQFDDGVRMDIHIETLSHALENIKNDSLCKILIDKNNYLPKIPESSDKDYWVKQPSQEQFLACCNEFWWCTNNLAKGLARKEILYVQDMANFVVRNELEKMLLTTALHFLPLTMVELYKNGCQ
jgi:aminoglycoside 6-adenylyltransferase